MSWLITKITIDIKIAKYFVENIHLEKKVQSIASEFTCIVKENGYSILDNLNIMFNIVNSIISVFKDCD